MFEWVKKLNGIQMRKGKTMAVLFKAQKISVVYGDYKLIKEVDLEIFEGEKIGVVGVNGCGKSTLLEIVAGHLTPSEGSCKWYKEASIAYMPQVSETSLKEAYLSGGERTKKRVQQALYQKHQVLILDEPTNHLDQHGIEWLIKEIQKEKGTVIVVSHDRYFLDQCVGRIIEIEDGNLKDYPGNYSWYRKEKRRQFESQLHAYKEQEKRKEKIACEMNRLKRWSQKAHQEAAIKARETGNKKGGREFNRAKAKKRDRQVKSKLKRLMKIEENGVVKPREEQSIAFEMNEIQKGNKRVIEAKQLQKYFGKRCLFEASNFYVLKGEKIGIYGPNGCGKSTLIKALLGEIQIEGELFLSESVKMGYMSQEVTDLPGEIKVQDYLEVCTKEQIRQALEMFVQMGFKRESLFWKISCLSHGEQVKIKLLKMILGACNFLVLDEPTNHMDLHVRETLEQALESYQGTLILVTHDRYMMNKVCNRLLVFENHQIRRFEDGLAAYEDKKTQSKKVSKKEEEKALLQIECELTYLIGQLSLLKQSDPRYKEMEQRYLQCLMKKKELVGTCSSVR